MAKARFVLRYRGEGAAPESDVRRVEAHPEVVVVDSSSRMLLVESDPRALQELSDTLPNWALAPDRAYEVPDTRKKVQGPPG